MSGMELRDVVVYTMLAVLFGGALIWALYSIFTRTRGDWSEEDRIRGEFRARKWIYKESVPSLKAHLLPGALTTSYFPALANGHATDALEGTGPGGEWRAAQFQPLGEAPRWYFSTQFRQRADAREVELPATLLVLSDLRDDAGAGTPAVSELGDGVWFVDQWMVRSVDPAAAGALLSPNLLKALQACDGLRFVHFVSDRVTFCLSWEKTEQRATGVIEEYIANSELVAKNIPELFWV